MNHPSLTAEFNPPPPLEPKITMPMNDKCWCGSGKKWKKCHRNRELQEKTPIGQFMARQRDETRKGYCLFSGASETTCTKNIIRAHTIQRQGGLLSIAEEGHVISPKKGFEDILKNKGEIIPRKFGLKDASTFMGFCGFHDNKMFEPIEKNALTLNNEAAFLLSFRAISYEYFMKDSGIRINHLQQDMDKGMPFEQQCYIQNFLYWKREGMKRGMAELEKWKSDYDKAYTSKSYSAFSFYGVRFSEVLPIVACGAFQPECDLNGNQLQIISRGNTVFESISFNLTSAGGKSIMVLGWIGEKGGPAEQFFNSFKELDDIKKSNATMYIAFEHLENIYFKPSWWNSLSDQINCELVARLRSGTGMAGRQRTSKSLANFQHVLSELLVEQELIS